MSGGIRRRGEIESPIQSPCVKTCVMHPKAGLCTGCLRSLDEIASWSGMMPAARAAIMAELPARRSRLA